MAFVTRRSLLAALYASFPGLALGRNLFPRAGMAVDRGEIAEQAHPGEPASTRKAPSSRQAQGSRAQYWFTDVAGRSSFTYRTNNSFTGRKYFPQPMCGGVAAIDYNDDGRMDLFFTNGSKLPELVKTTPEYYNCLLRNKGDGTFEDVTAK